MRADSTEERNADRLRAVPRRRFMILTMLLSLNAFVLGGCVALLIVNRLLSSQLDVYTATQSMAAASSILDLMDDLLYYYLIYGAVLFVLVLGTASVWTWMVTQSRILRYGMILLCLILVVVFGGVWLMGRREAPVVPSTTPTPSMGSSLLMEVDILHLD
jgi:hypothetical protein